MTWSTPASSKRSRYSRTWAGVPGGAPQSGPVPRGQPGPQAFLAQGGLHLGRVAVIAPAVEELRPDVGRTGLVLTEDVVVPERVAEEVAALETPVDRASSSSGWHIIWVTQAMLGLTARPTGTHDSASVRS